MEIQLAAERTDLGCEASCFAGALAVSVDPVPDADSVVLTATSQDSAGQRWQSAAQLPKSVPRSQGWRAGSDSPACGTYSGGDAFGLLWSAQPLLGQPPVRCNHPPVAGHEAMPLSAPVPEGFRSEWTLTLEVETRPVAELFVVRDLGRRVRWSLLEHPRLRGMQFEPLHGNGRRPVGAVILGGSEGGAPLARAAALAERGLCTLALGYFACEDLPASGRELPLEYFFEAVDWFARELAVEQVGIFGASRGSEAAVYAASYASNRVGAVVLQAPSPVVNGGLSDHQLDFRRDEQAMWTLQDRPLRVEPFPLEKQDAAQRRKEAMGALPGHRFEPEFRALWNSRGFRERYRLPAADAPAPFLLLAGADDGLWPSALGAEWLAEDRVGLPTEKIIYPNVGHALRPPVGPDPFSPLARWDHEFGMRSAWVDCGGAAKANALAGVDALARTAEFFQRQLGDD